MTSKVSCSTFDATNHPSSALVLSHAPPAHSAHSGLTQSASGTCSRSLALRWLWSPGACTRAQCRFGGLHSWSLHLTNWAAAELNHPNPGQRAERGDNLGSRVSCPSRPVLHLGTSHTHTTQPHCRLIHTVTLVGATCFCTAVCAHPEFSRCDERASINVSRGISPRVTSAIFAFTVENNLLDGTSCVWVMIALSIAGQRFVARVPALERPSLM